MSIYSGWWHVAYRKLPCGTVLTDIETPFKVIRNNLCAFAADPFLFEYNGKVYIFAEICSVIRKGGMIGYSCFDGKKFSKWKVVIKEPYHLSFPNIFMKDESIYIVPEAFQSKCLYAYRAVDFPDVWERSKTILSDIECVDSVFADSGNNEYLFTYEITDPNNKALYKYLISDWTALNDTRTLVRSDSENSRPAGNFFRTEDGTLYRVAQDCKDSYGSAVVFNRVNELNKDAYSEETVQRVERGGVNLDKKTNYSGIHTYNGTNRFEVIDLKWQIIHPISLPYKLGRHIIMYFKNKKQ